MFDTYGRPLAADWTHGEVIVDDGWRHDTGGDG